METGPKLGETGRRVAANVKALRGRTPVREFSDLMSKVGRPILPSGITKIELGSRRVDVDDLVALAVALDVTPNRLLLTDTASLDDDSFIELVPERPLNAVPTQRAWEWANGEWDLLNPYAWGGADGINLTRADEQRRRWYANARPNDTSATDTLADLEPHKEKLAKIAAMVDELADDGLARGSVLNYLKWTQPRATGLDDGEDD